MAKKINKQAKKPISDKKKHKQTEINPKTEEFISLFTLVGGILLCIFLYFPQGFVGSFIKEIACGLFGWPVFLVPVLLIANGLHKSAKDSYEIHKSKYFVIIAAFGVLSVMTHMLAVQKENPFLLTNMLANYTQGKGCIGGGLLGGFVADIFRVLIGQVASVIVAITALLTATMMLVDWSPVKMLLRVILKTYSKTNSARVSAKVRAEKERKQTEENNDDAVFTDFSDEDLGIRRGHVAKVKKVKRKAGGANDEAAANDSDEFASLDNDALEGIDRVIDEAVP
ncbi:MAG: DNA translocase FtsK 4TM domain-containing protein, partial [Clostridia bacterium]|nr:DNA translocase FtsK 4TM domain-containing protein [Clostridia bacterium]